MPSDQRATRCIVEVTSDDWIKCFRQSNFSQSLGVNHFFIFSVLPPLLSSFYLPLHSPLPLPNSTTDFLTHISLNPLFWQLSNAIEPFLQSSCDEDTLNAVTPGKFTPQPSIGLVRSQSRERYWGAALEGGKSGIKLFLTELQQANIYAALNRALVHIARWE